MIAVSVDMLDTGIDIPEVVNLVFAKPVYSQVKFWQMIGRGTRLRPRLFGPGTVENPASDDKTHFLIMDYCGNLDFFAANPKGKVSRQPEPLTSSLFKTALALSERLKKGDEELAAIGRKHRQFCVDFVAAIDAKSFVIRPKLRYVEKYQAADVWNDLKDESIDELFIHVAPLPSTLDLGDESARRWDLLLMEAELLFLDGSPRFGRFKASIQVTAEDLKGRSSIPEVRAALPLLKAVCTEEYWAELSLEDLETIREGMRDLLKFIESEAKKIVYSNLADSVDLVVSDPPPIYSGIDLTQYRKRMDVLLEANRDHLTIAKLRRLVPLTELDLAELDRLLFAGKEEEREVFIRLYGDKSRTEFEIENPPVSLLIRSIVGLERPEVEKKLAAYINTAAFNPYQLAFIDKLIDFFVRDGFVPVGALYEPPFDQYHEGGPEKLFGTDADRVIEFVRFADRLALSPADASFKESV
jgi:type I restriction enzyme R subunit